MVEPGREPNFFFFLIQQALVPVLAFLALVVTAQVPAAFNFGMHNQVVDNWWAMFVVVSFTLALGFLAAHLTPNFADDGRFIWAIPTTLLVMGIGFDFRHGFSREIRDAFFPIGENEVGLLFSFVTLPTYACIAYSLGVACARRMLGPRA